MRYNALHDRETELLNRAGLKEVIGQMLVYRKHALLHVASLGIERYSSFQSVLGTARSSELVAEAGKRIVEILPHAPIARIAPDCLAVAFYSPDRHAARETLEQLSILFNDAINIGDSHVDVQLSIGVSYGIHGDNPVRMVQQSETAVVQARNMGLPLAFFDPHAEQQAADNLTLLSDLRSGLENGAVWLSFQPKLTVKTGKIESAECLIRWNHPTLGPVGPDKFIPLAEETGFVHPLTDWVVEQAIHAQKLLDAKGIFLNMAVNISVRSLSDLQFTSHLIPIFERCHADPKRFTLELTESAIMVRTRESLVTLRLLRERGFTISIDDFGTGQSSLAYLRHLPADELKIDRAFITDLASDKRDQRLVQSTIDLAHALDLKIVAEGVEDAAALAILGKVECDVAQGYHIARPMSIDKLAELLTPKHILLDGMDVLPLRQVI